MSSINQLELAKQICIEAHKGQVDKGGADYYLHPFHVARRCKNIDEKIVALLHDVVEDTNITLADLTKFFESDIIDAVDAITKQDGISYDDYLSRVKKNPIARKVKIQDLIHNSDLSRLNEVSEKDLKRVEKYKKSIAYLKDAK